MQGYGVYTWPDNRKYEGQYANDKKQGFGIYTWPDGRVYEGYWMDGKQHDLGVIRQGKDVKCGLWERGKRLRWFDKEEIEAI